MDRKALFNCYFILCIVILKCFCIAEDCKKNNSRPRNSDLTPSEPPRIKSPYTHEYEVNAFDEFEFYCEANQNITWSYPNVPTKPDFQYWSQPRVSFSKTANKDYPYGAKLELTNVSYSDTGYYYCHYQTATDLSNSLLSTSVYVYVRDENKLMLELNPADIFITGIQGRPLVIPCRPTARDVTVTLFRGDEKVINILSYDPKAGFKISTNSLNDGGDYTCFASNKKINETLDITVILDLASESISQPDIVDQSKFHHVAGEMLSLKCVLPSFTPPIELSWNVPDCKKISTGHVQVTGAHEEPQSDGSKNAVSTLIIDRLETSDSGEYECVAVDNSEHSTSEKVVINVLENNPFINLKPKFNMTQKVMAGNNVSWVVMISSYPEAEIKWFNQRNSAIEWDTDRKKYNEQTTSTESVLTISDVNLNDMGKYTIRASNPLYTNLTKDLNFTLKVYSRPSIIINPSVDLYHADDHPVVAQCIVAANPKNESILWILKPCLNRSCTGRQVQRKFVETKSINSTHTTSKISIMLNEPGFLKCVAENKFGRTSSKEIKVLTSDLLTGVTGFKVWRDTEDKIGVGEDVLLQCGISKYIETKNKLKWFSIFNGTRTEIQSSTNFIITSRETQYSRITELIIKNISKAQSGDYGCSADDSHYDKMYLIIDDPKAPSFSFPRFNKTTKRMLGQPLELKCTIENGIPFPVITWWKNDEKLKNNSHVFLKNRNQILSIPELKESDKGTYKCIAQNKKNTISKITDVVFTGTGPDISIIIIIIALAIILMTVVGILIYKIRQEQKLRKELRIAGLAHFEEGLPASLNPEIGIDDQADLLPYDRKFEFPREKLKLGKQLGSGAFGVVMKAEAQGITPEEEVTTVAVKMVKRNADLPYLKALADELKIMIHLGQHLNVVNLLGACTKNLNKMELLVIVEYCRFGNVHNYLLRHRKNFVNQIDPQTGKINDSIDADLLCRSFSESESNRMKYALLAFSHSGGSTSGMSDGNPSSPSAKPHNSMADYRSGISQAHCNTASTVVYSADGSVCISPQGDEGVILSNNSVQPEWRSNYRGDYRGNVKPVCTRDLVCWAFQVARGMEYLVSRRVLHGDLAARNILLAEKNVVKICDFGLAKSMYKSDNYKKKGDGPLPVKWMAIESISDKVFSTQSDVWAFGIVLWELFSLAKTPYPGMPADEIFYNRLKEGYRMEQPEYATRDLYDIMLDCWQHHPKNRPSFGALAERLGGLLEETVRQHYLDLNDPYFKMNVEQGKNDYITMLSSPDYGNLESTNEEGYLNELHPASATHSSGYLSMSPSNAIFSPRHADDDSVFDFDVQREKVTIGQAKVPELTPMLKTLSTHSESEDDNIKQKSFSNPTYQLSILPNNVNSPQKISPNSDNYVNIQRYGLQKNSSQCDNNSKLNDLRIISPGAGNYINSSSKDWESHFNN